MGNNQSLKKSINLIDTIYQTNQELYIFETPKHEFYISKNFSQSKSNYNFNEIYNTKYILPKDSTITITKFISKNNELQLLAYIDSSTRSEYLTITDYSIWPKYKKDLVNVISLFHLQPNNSIRIA